MAKSKDAPLRLPPAPANAGIQEELLALLDDRSADSVYSLHSGSVKSDDRSSQGGPHQRRGAAGAQQSRTPPSSRGAPLPPRPPPPRRPPPSSRTNNGIRPVERPGDRSVPPKLRDWIRDANNGGAGPQQRRRGGGPGPRNGDGWGGRGGRTKKSSGDDSSEHDAGEQLTRYLLLVVVGICVFFYKKSVSSSPHSSSSLSSPSTGMPSSINAFRNGRGRDYEDKSVAPRAQFNFIDAAWRGKDMVQFETLLPPSEIDFAVQGRSRRARRGGRERDCDDILLYLPRTSRGGGGKGERGAELFNGYLLAALLATYTGKAMVLLEPPDEEATAPATGDYARGDPSRRHRAGSLFDCPVDAFEREVVRDGKRTPHPLNPPRDAFPRGLSRILRHPEWLSRGCPVPCRSSYDFDKWNDLRERRVRQVTCQNDNDRQARVFAVGAEDARRYFEDRWREQMLRRPVHAAEYAARARDWALRLGARGHEARTFGRLQREGDVWDYVSALLARSGIVRLQPWIARDVKMLIKGSGLPLNWPYVAVYVHRDDDSAASKADDFVPFYDYLREWEHADCTRGEAHPVYVATNDPRRIREEIGRLPKDGAGNTLLRECVKLRFVFNPVDPLPAGGGREAGYDCAALHKADVAAISDLMILAKGDTFVGEFRSNLGRLVRIFRTAVNDFPERGDDGPVLVRNTRFVPGRATGRSGGDPGT